MVQSLGTGGKILMVSSTATKQRGLRWKAASKVAKASEHTAEQYDAQWHEKPFQATEARSSART